METWKVAGLISPGPNSVPAKVFVQAEVPDRPNVICQWVEAATEAAPWPFHDELGFVSDQLDS